MFIRINGELHYLWRAVDQHGVVLDILVQDRRNATAAKRFFKRLLKGLWYKPRRLITDGLRSYGEFMERQLLPAVRTCETVAARQEALSRRLTRACHLLRARVEMTLQEQNRDLLRSMDRRANLQLRLQETVEGLSVVAISYYAFSLIGYMTGAVARVSGQAWPGWLTEVGAAVGVPIVVGVAWLAMHRIRHRLR